MKPKILLIDIETAPLELLGWQMYGDISYQVNQIKKDWSVLAWSAKWVGKTKVYYEDTSKQKNIRNDSRILKNIYKLLEQADVIVSQNGIRFDIPKLNARFIANNMPPLDVDKLRRMHIDTKKIAKKHFAFTSNSLEYLCQVLKVKHKKLTHRKYPGFELWKECLAKNKSAWEEMRAYNIRDVIALEEVYKKLAPWGTGVNLGVFYEDSKHRCPECGSHHTTKHGFKFTNKRKVARYSCHSCGAWSYGSKNLLGGSNDRKTKK